MANRIVNLCNLFFTHPKYCDFLVKCWTPIRKNSIGNCETPAKSVDKLISENFSNVTLGNVILSCRNFSSIDRQTKTENWNWWVLLIIIFTNIQRQKSVSPAGEKPRILVIALGLVTFLQLYYLCYCHATATHFQFRRSHERQHVVLQFRKGWIRKEMSPNTQRWQRIGMSCLGCLRHNCLLCGC